MRDYSAIYLPTISWCQIYDSFQTSGSDLWPRLCNETSGPVSMLRPLAQGWCVASATHASHPMSGRNRNRYYYLLSTSFVRSFSRSDYTLWSASGPRRNSPSDESRTHIQLFIWTYPLGSSRVTSRPSSTRLCYQAHYLSITTLPSPLLIE